MCILRVISCTVLHKTSHAVCCSSCTSTQLQQALLGSCERRTALRQSRKGSHSNSQLFFGVFSRLLKTLGDGGCTVHCDGEPTPLCAVLQALKGCFSVRLGYTIIFSLADKPQRP